MIRTALCIATKVIDSLVVARVPHHPSLFQTQEQSRQQGDRNGSVDPRILVKAMNSNTNDLFRPRSNQRVVFRPRRHARYVSRRPKMSQACLSRVSKATELTSMPVERFFKLLSRLNSVNVIHVNQRASPMAFPNRTSNRRMCPLKTNRRTPKISERRRGATTILASFPQPVEITTITNGFNTHCGH